jgi:hypothetical protein
MYPVSLVIARSVSDEAIELLLLCFLDCFAVLAMTLRGQRNV